MMMNDDDLDDLPPWTAYHLVDPAHRSMAEVEIDVEHTPTQVEGDHPAHREVVRSKTN